MRCILTIIAKETGDQVMQSLMQAILERDKMSADSLQALLVSDNPVSQQLGLRYLTQNPQDYWQAAIENTLWQQLERAKIIGNNSLPK